jgi:hypothetical protein
MKEVRQYLLRLWRCAGTFFSVGPGIFGEEENFTYAVDWRIR